jgi:hypothetical protein
VTDVPPIDLPPIDDFLRRELEVLELLLDDANLASLRASEPLHPAVIRHDRVSAFLSNATFHFPDDTNFPVALGSALLDSLTLGPTALPQSILTEVGDEEVLRQLRARARAPSQFADQMTAFHCWSLLRTAGGYTPRLIEQEGMPDIFLPLDDRPGVWIECKHIQLQTSATRARQILKNANKQIKRADPDGSGLLYVLIERPEHRISFDDAIPPAVDDFVSEIRRRLGSGQLRSVANVILCWDDYMVLGSPPDRTAYFFRRRSIVLSHNAPRRSLQLPANLSGLGRTVTFSIHWSGATQSVVKFRPVQAGSIIVTQQFRDICEATGDVRADYAIAAMERPDSRVNYDLGGSELVLATKKISIAPHPYTLLLIAAVRDGKLQIELGFRLYADLTSGEPPSDPFALFTTFLDNFGLPVTAGDQTGLLVPSAVVPIASEDPTKIVQALASCNEEYLVYGVFRIRDSEPPVADVKWAFAISRVRYREYAQAHRS